MQLLPGISLLNMLMISHLLIFLKNIKTFFRPKSKSIFGIQDPVGLRYLFQLRVSLSPLRSHRSHRQSHNFIDIPSEICQCNHVMENTNHFLFSCPSYVIYRATIVSSVINILERNNLNPLANQVELYLYGHRSINFIENKTYFC